MIPSQSQGIAVRLLFLKDIKLQEELCLISPGSNRSQGAMGSPAGVSARLEDHVSSPRVLSYITTCRTSHTTDKTLKAMESHRKFQSRKGM